VILFERKSAFVFTHAYFYKDTSTHTHTYIYIYIYSYIFTPQSSPADCVQTPCIIMYARVARQALNALSSRALFNATLATLKHVSAHTRDIRAQLAAELNEIESTEFRRALLQVLGLH
jgi:hypothetical protein